ncbi:MAG: RsbRD N-terminal domain-containing protein [Thermodesulfovibrionales bacterium]|nr:RsbRD N-terminal domain-containing protein [Thermodesulfovibrionales bacterium]
MGSLNLDMGLRDILSEKKPAILKRWFDAIVDTYPANTAEFLKSQQDRFANPVGHAISQGIEEIFDELMAGVDPERVSPFLDNILRVRAVQDFKPAEAVSFIFLLKKAIREEMKNLNGQTLGELPELESGIDELALCAFNVYMKCREDLYTVKANELRNMTSRLLERANIIRPTGGLEPETKEAVIKVKRKEVTE